MRWFKHDTDASNDSRLKKLIKKHGLQGYGLFFLILELMTRKIDNHLDEAGYLPLEYDDEALAIESEQSTDSVRTMLDYMITIGLFEQKDGRLYNKRIPDRCDDYTNRLLRKRKKLGIKSEQSPNKVRTVSGESPSRVNKIRKDKIRKENNNTSNIKATDTVAEMENGKISINSLIGKFKELNPMYQRLYPNKTQRAALERIVKTYNLEWVDKLLDQLPAVVNKPYAPKITTPTELEIKMGQLKQFMAQEKNKEGRTDGRVNLRIITPDPDWK